MSGPDFDDLVGEEVTGAERERLFAAHRALLAAGAPPELSPRLEHPPKPPSARVVRLPQRRRFAALVAAAAVAAVVFAAGFTGGWVGRGGFASVVGPVRMEGTAAAPGALASIRIGKPDRSGNWPSQMSVRGLPPLPQGGYYLLYLTRKATGRRVVVCTAFAVRRGTTTVTFNFPGNLKGAGWIVVRELPGHAEDGRVLMTTA